VSRPTIIETALRGLLNFARFKRADNSAGF